MADEPRTETREKNVSDWCPDYSGAGRRTFLAELDRADPLRVLLADEDRALEFAAKARYDAARRRFDLPAWEDVPDWSKAACVAEAATEVGPVLAALREEANG